MDIQHPTRDDTEWFKLEDVDDVPGKSTTPPPAAAPDAPRGTQGHVGTGPPPGVSAPPAGQDHSFLPGNGRVVARNGLGEVDHGLHQVRQASAASKAAHFLGRAVMADGSGLQSRVFPSEQTVSVRSVPSSVQNQVLQDGDNHGTRLTTVNLRNHQQHCTHMNGEGISGLSGSSGSSGSSIDVNLNGDTPHESRSRRQQAHHFHCTSVRAAQNQPHGDRTLSPETRRQRYIRDFYSNRPMATIPGYTATDSVAPDSELDLSDENAPTGA